MHVVAGPGSRKARNLVDDLQVVLTARSDGLDLVVEGEARKVRDDAGLRRVAAAYRSKYEWPVTVRDGAFCDAEAAPTAGPPPYEAYVITPTVAFGFPVDERFTPTRWRF